VRLTLAGGGTLEASADLDAPLPLADRRARIAAKIRALLPPAAAEAVLALDADLGGAAAGDVAAALARHAAPMGEGAAP
jgi:hypothetical protein